MKVLRSKHCPLSSIHPPLHSSSFTRLKGLPLLDTNFYATTWQRLQLSRSLRRPSRVPLDFPTNLSRFYLLKRPCCLYLQVRYSNSLCVVSYAPKPTKQFPSQYSCREIHRGRLSSFIIVRTLERRFQHKEIQPWCV